MARRGGKILTSSRSQQDILARLATGLHTLLEIAKKGEWEKIDGLHPELLLSMEALRAAPIIAPGTVDHGAQLEHIQLLLQSAILVCTERKEQIVALVNAFAKAKNPPPQP